ncbi:rhodanese-like domain-containing protein [Patescibacteria group bacterium]|nr:MAG: rhodanese-like domain-containing protein [Patescibacteria group bacterium]
MNKAILTIVVSVLLGAAAGAGSAWGIVSLLPARHASDAELIADFYRTESAVHVSPHGLRKMMDKGDDSFVLVDLRSAEEYALGHVTGAVSIPAYKDKDTSAYDEVDRITEAFAALPKEKDVIVYCYSIPCMTGRKVGKMLAERGIFVKHLGIGWNEWKHDWTGWNHEHEWKLTKAADYITIGPDPGTPKANPASKACPIDGDMGC